MSMPKTMRRIQSPITKPGVSGFEGVAAERRALPSARPRELGRVTAVLIEVADKFDSMTVVNVQAR